MAPDCRVFVGTCSWADRSLLECGEFYPPDVVGNAEKRLRYYASRFPTVEVDSSFYAIPDQKTVATWAGRLPARFVMHLKTFGALTGHAVRPESLPGDLREEVRRNSATESADGDRLLVKDSGILRELSFRFVKATIPLRASSHLGFVLYQFSPRFTWSERRLEFLQTISEWMSPCRLMFEFRHASWAEKGVFSKVCRLISELGQGIVTADEPQIGAPLTIPFTLVCAATWAI